MLMLKILLWAFATFLAGSLSGVAGGASNVQLKAVLIDGTKVCIFLATLLLVIAYGAAIWIFLPLNQPVWLKVLLSGVAIGLTAFLERGIKNLFN